MTAIEPTITDAMIAAGIAASDRLALGCASVESQCRAIYLAMVASAPQEPDDALIGRLAASIAEHRAHINGLQEQYGAGTIPDERCAGIVLNFGDVIDLYTRLQAKAPETDYSGIVKEGEG